MSVPDPNDIFSEFQDIFQGFFGGEVRRDIHQTLELSLLEASEGCTRTIEVRATHECRQCGGRGADTKGWRPCSSCDGTGKTGRREGAFELRSSCTPCNGKGGRIHIPCDRCNGHGKRERLRHPTVTVPPGIDDGQVLRLKDLGNSASEEKGDLLLMVQVTPDPRIEREGADLLVVVPISYRLAANGGQKDVPIPGGTMRIDVPAQTRTGNDRRLLGYGCVRFGSKKTPRPVEAGTPYRSVDMSGQRGDLIVTFVVGDDAVPGSLRTHPMPLAPDRTTLEDAISPPRSLLIRALIWLGFPLAASLLHVPF